MHVLTNGMAGRCETQGFRNPEPGKSEALLLEEVENYFMSGVVDPTKRIRPTNLPPIFFQHPGESRAAVHTLSFCLLQAVLTR